MVSAIPSILELFPDKVGSIKITGITGEHDEGKDRIIDTTSAREALRQYILDSNYEWSLWLDNDILVPSNITERFLNYLKKHPNLLMAHSFHPARQPDVELRHGIGSSFIHRKVLHLYPFTYIGADGYYLGDDQIWFTVVSYFIRVFYKDSFVEGCLFDLKHLCEDGTVVKLPEKYRGELL